ncbi:MAG: helix-turn-helix domain-containing protein [Xanthomonadales bacterium]|nr:helix-turn-helix domain-containing protein [Xanthomonadales bacterium]
MGHAPASYRTRPAAGTVRAAVLDALLSGRSLTSLEAWRELGTSRLAADVHELRRMGWPIVTVDVPVACRAGRTSRVACYSLAGGRE